MKKDSKKIDDNAKRIRLEDKVIEQIAQSLILIAKELNSPGNEGCSDFCYKPK